MSAPRLIVFAGLPGSGKSTVADRVAGALGVAVVSVDPIEQGLHDAGIAPSEQRGLAAYLVAARLTDHLLGLGQRVVVDAVNAEPEGRATWVTVGERHGLAPTWVEVRCSDADLHRTRLAGRGVRYDGVDEPSWEAVQARAPGFAAWTDERLVVDTAADLDVTVAYLVAAL